MYKQTKQGKDAIAYFFQLSNQLQTVFDHKLVDYNLTIKQVFLMIVIDSFDDAPGYSAVSERFGTSRQNVKQLALKLEKNGYIRIIKDPEDSRYRRLNFTDKANKFWQENAELDQLMLDRLFHNVSERDLSTFIRTLMTIQDNINEIESRS